MKKREDIFDSLLGLSDIVDNRYYVRYFNRYMRNIRHVIKELNAVVECLNDRLVFLDERMDKLKAAQSMEEVREIEKEVMHIFREGQLISFVYVAMFRNCTSRTICGENTTGEAWELEPGELQYRQMTGRLDDQSFVISIAEGLHRDKIDKDLDKDSVTKAIKKHEKKKAAKG